ncbi:MAG TPA: DMT family transporter [Paracoccaceae bacterium]|nr:DMT family transporter [Paracoccaceae bacterium]
MRMTARDWGMLLCLSLLWGASFFFVGVALAALPPLTLVACRLGLGALALWAYVLATGRPVPARPGIWAAFAAMGLMNNVIPFSLFAWAQTEIPSGLAAILNATTPIFTALVAGALLPDERLTAGRAAGVLVGAAGAVTVIGPGFLTGLGQDLLAQAACLAAALSYALSSVFGRRFRGMRLDPVVTAAGMVTASALLLLPAALALDRPWALSLPGPGVLGAVAGLAILSTALAYVIFYRVLASAGTNVMLVTFLIPVSAILLGAAFLGERLELLDFAGMGLIALGLSLIDGRIWRRPGRPAEAGRLRGG